MMFKYLAATINVAVVLWGDQCKVEQRIASCQQNFLGWYFTWKVMFILKGQNGNRNKQGSKVSSGMNRFPKHPRQEPEKTQKQTALEKGGRERNDQERDPAGLREGAEVAALRKLTLRRPSVESFAVQARQSLVNLY